MSKSETSLAHSINFNRCKKKCFDALISHALQWKRTRTQEPSHSRLTHKTKIKWKGYVQLILHYEQTAGEQGKRVVRNERVSKGKSHYKKEKRNFAEPKPHLEFPTRLHTFVGLTKLLVFSQVLHLLACLRAACYRTAPSKRRDLSPQNNVYKCRLVHQ